MGLGCPPVPTAWAAVQESPYLGEADTAYSGSRGIRLQCQLKTVLRHTFATFLLSLRLVQKLVSEDNSDRTNPTDTQAPAGSAQEGGGVSKATHVTRVSEGLSLGSALPAAQRGPRSHLPEATHTCSCRFYFLPMTHFSFCLRLHRLPPAPSNPLQGVSSIFSQTGKDLAKSYASLGRPIIWRL